MKLIKRLNFSWWVIGILVATLIVILPLLQKGFIVSDDGNWMVIRLSAFFQSFREGQFPVRFLGRLNNSYGYPVANFLYPGFLYIGSFIHLLGFSFPNSVKIIFIGSVTLSSLLIFFWLKKYFSSFPSFLGSLGFLFSPYLIFDIYKRGSVGEVLAVFAGAAALFSIERDMLWLVPPTMGFLIISHNSLGLLFFLFLLSYILVRKRVNFFVPVFIGLGLSTFFWFPAIYERKFILFDMVTVSQPQQYFIEGSMLYLLGLVNVFAFLMVLKDSHKEKRGVRDFFLVMFVISVLLSTSLSNPVWMAPFMEKLFQFPYRFLSLSLIAAPWLIACMTQKIEKKYQWHTLLLFFVLFVVSTAPVLFHIKLIERPDGYYTTNEATTTVANEYMPRWVKEAPRDRAHQRMVFFQGKGKIEAKVMSTQKIDAIILADEPSIIQVNSVYYPGWGIAIDDQFVAPDYQNVYGLMRVPISAGKHRFVAEFRETILRFLADMVSVVFLIFYFCYVVWIVRVKKKH